MAAGDESEVRRCDDPAMDSTEDASDALASNGGSTFTPASVRSGEHGEMGRRRSMEDASVCLEGLAVAGCARPVAFYGIFDGHGGTTAAEFVSTHLVPNIISDPAFAKDPAGAMRAAFLRTDRQLCGRGAAADEDNCSGSTALCVCLLGGELLVANAGDCRAVLSRRGKAIDLSTDQRPSCSTELARIERAGGFVEDGYINGHLGVARAFGDFHIEGLKGDPEGNRPGPLIVEPEVDRWTLTEEDEFLIIACDGIWDVFSSHNAVDFVRQALRRHNDTTAAARELTMEALRRDSADNVSVIVVCFGEDPPPDKVQEKRTAPLGHFARAISSEGLSELQKALQSDDRAAVVAAQQAPKLQRVNSINPRRSIDGQEGRMDGQERRTDGQEGGQGGGGLMADFMVSLDTLDVSALGGNSDSGDTIDQLSPLPEE